MYSLGHAIGAGAFLALAHDYCIMRSDRGWWWVPAAIGGVQLPDGFITLLRSRMLVVCQSMLGSVCVGTSLL